MKEDSLEFLCCPSCYGDLILSAKTSFHDRVISGLLECQACKRTYNIKDGTPDFLLPESLTKKDRKWMFQYDRMARSYDIIMSYIAPFFSAGVEPFERYMWAKHLQTNKGALILDVSTGTGRNLPFIKKQVGDKGKIVAMDISKGMLTYARMKAERKGWKNIEFHRANASHLPYRNDTFNGVMHVGGINTFGEKRRALEEMIRVAKQDAKIVIVDEGLAPRKQETFFGKFLTKTNALYACKPPTTLLPKNIKDLTVTWKIIPDWIFINTSWPFYKLEFQKALSSN